MIALLLTLEILARVLVGECGPMGAPCQYLVATSVQARLEAGTFGDSVPAVLTAYYGDAPATESSRRMAWALLTGRVPSLGLPYAYSAEDRARHGWGPGDVVLSYWADDGILELHLARRVPWGSE